MKESIITDIVQSIYPPLFEAVLTPGKKDRCTVSMDGGTFEVTRKPDGVFVLSAEDGESSFAATNAVALEALLALMRHFGAATTGELLRAKALRPMLDDVMLRYTACRIRQICTKRYSDTFATYRFPGGIEGLERLEKYTLLSVKDAAEPVFVTPDREFVTFEFLVHEFLNPVTADRLALFFSPQAALNKTVEDEMFQEDREETDNEL